ncbi:MAG TPA: GH3 auxin-responsive promoter family protein, partial [Myxococcota bacterium]|nr:GH3 auxin-responsive promoter family protein [Myxococcota bacterium]
PGVAIRPAPMAFAEGTVTVPSWDRVGAPLAVTAHVYEFVNLDAPRTPPTLVDGVRVGGLYQPLLTTAGGLYRYALPDVVECVGTQGALPLLRYVDKAEPVSVAAEALTAATVQRALEAACAELSFELRFALCTPLGDRGYALYVESPGTGAALARLGEEVEEQLCRHHGYWYCRRLGQLAPLQIFRVKDGVRRYRAALRDQGLPEWELRSTALDGRALWAEVFGAPAAA